uniref:peptidylprolyl isomerase n=1 Tax=Tanacetum cinerariifolium TaxID=118510 RepID=A0A699GFC5_TANCI|nr:hypothetical protein [Tanacetum cinerariifolium]
MGRYLCGKAGSIPAAVGNGEGDDAEAEAEAEVEAAAREAVIPAHAGIHTPASFAPSARISACAGSRMVVPLFKSCAGGVCLILPAPVRERIGQSAPGWHARCKLGIGQHAAAQRLFDGGAVHVRRAADEDQFIETVAVRFHPCGDDGVAIGVARGGPAGAGQVEEGAKALRMQRTPLAQHEAFDAVLLGFGRMEAGQLARPAGHPACLFQVEPAGAQDLVQRHPAPFRQHDGGRRIEGLDDGAYFAQLVDGNQVGLADDDDVGKFDLLGQQRGQRAVVIVARALAALGQEVGAVVVVQQVDGVHHRDHGVDAGDVVERVAVFVGKVERGRHRHRLAHARRFDQQVIEAVLARQLAHLQQQVFTQRAADAAVAHLDHFFLGARQRGASIVRAMAQQRRVDIDLAHVVDDDSDPQAVAVGQDVVEQGGLARAQKTGQNGYGQAGIGRVALPLLFLRAVRAGALDQEVHFLALEAGGQRQRARQGNVREARHFVAAGALEVRMFVRVVAGAGAEAPHLVAAGNPVHQFVFGEPFEHAVQRDRVERFIREQGLDFVVGQGFLLAHQEVEYRHPLPGDTGAGSAYQRFCLVGGGCVHRMVIRWPSWMLPPRILPCSAMALLCPTAPPASAANRPSQHVINGERITKPPRSTRHYSKDQQLPKAETMNAYDSAARTTQSINATANGSQISLIGAQQNDLLRALSRDDLLALFSELELVALPAVRHGRRRHDRDRCCRPRRRGGRGPVSDRTCVVLGSGGSGRLRLPPAHRYAARRVLRRRPAGPATDALHQRHVRPAGAKRGRQPSYQHRTKAVPVVARTPRPFDDQRTEGDAGNDRQHAGRAPRKRDRRGRQAVGRGFDFLPPRLRDGDRSGRHGSARRQLLPGQPHESGSHGTAGSVRKSGKLMQYAGRRVHQEAAEVHPRGSAGGHGVQLALDQLVPGIGPTCGQLRFLRRTGIHRPLDSDFLTVQSAGGSNHSSHGRPGNRSRPCKIAAKLQFRTDIYLRHPPVSPLPMPPMWSTNFTKNALAGLTTSFALVPECIAFALVAHLNPLVGLGDRGAGRPARRAVFSGHRGRIRRHHAAVWRAAARQAGQHGAAPGHAGLCQRPGDRDRLVPAATLQGRRPVAARPSPGMDGRPGGADHGRRLPAAAPDQGSAAGAGGHRGCGLVVRTAAPAGAHAGRHGHHCRRLAVVQFAAGAADHGHRAHRAAVCAADGSGGSAGNAADRHHDPAVHPVPVATDRAHPAGGAGGGDVRGGPADLCLELAASAGQGAAPRRPADRGGDGHYRGHRPGRGRAVRDRDCRAQLCLAPCARNPYRCGRGRPRRQTLHGARHAVLCVDCPLQRPVRRARRSADGDSRLPRPAPCRPFRRGGRLHAERAVRARGQAPAGRAPVRALRATARTRGRIGDGLTRLSDTTARGDGVGDRASASCYRRGAGHGHDAHQRQRRPAAASSQPDQNIRMQIATIISLAGSITCVGLFSKQKEWVLAAAFVFAAAFTTFAAFRPSFIPGYIVPWRVWRGMLPAHFAQPSTRDNDMKKMLTLSALGLALALGLAGCGGGGGDDAVTVPTVPDTITLQKIDTVTGTGAEAVAGKAVTVHYTGYLYDASKTGMKGARFDTSVGSLPLGFVVGDGRLIKGFDEGVRGMKVGGKRTVIIPASMGYGNKAMGTIPANANLVFDIELLTRCDGRCHAGAVGRIGLGTVMDMAFLHRCRDAADGARRVLEQQLLLFLRQQAEQVAGLRVVIGVHAVVPVRGRAFQRQRRLGKFRILHPLATAVRLVRRAAAVIAVDAHRAVAVVAVERALGRVDGDRVVIHAQAVAGRVAVREQARLQHLVGRKTHARHHVGRRESRLLHFRKIVFRIAIEFQHAHVDQRVVLVRPHLGQVERVVRHLGGVGLGHDLHGQLPAREIAVFDGVEQVALRAFAVAAHELGGFGVAQIGDALLAHEVELDPEPLVFRADEAEGMAAEAVHVAVALGYAAVAHDDGDLVQRFGQQSPEVPVVFGRTQVGFRIAFDHVVEVGELERIAEEEHGRVVAHDVPVALLGIELDGEAADVAFGIGRAALAGHGGKAHEDVGLLAHFRKQRGARVLGDVVGHRKGAVGARALGVHAALGDHFAREVRQLFQVPHVLQQDGTARAGGLGVLVVDDGRAGSGGEVLHGPSLGRWG